METTFPAFVDPYSKHPLQPDEKGNLYAPQDGQLPLYCPVDGSYDFVRDIGDEREHYEEEYQQGEIRSLDADEIRGPWFNAVQPWYGDHLKSIGDLPGKNILLVGAGRSCKEFYFAACGANVVFTDLSLQGVLASAAEYKSAHAILDNLSTTTNG